MTILSRLFAPRDPRAAARPLHASVVAHGRNPAWYLHAGVPDSVDGRFEALSLVLCLVLLRLEAEGEDDDARRRSVLLTEAFVEDMDGQLRQFGVGDLVVGKHIGKMMSALGGRLTAYREGLALADDAALAEALKRNLYRGEPVGDAALGFAVRAVRAGHAALAALPRAAVMTGEIDPLGAALDGVKP